MNNEYTPDGWLIIDYDLSEIELDPDLFDREYQFECHVGGRDES